MPVPKIVDAELNNFIVDCILDRKIVGIAHSKIPSVIQSSSIEFIDSMERGKPAKILLVEYDRDTGEVTYYTEGRRYKMKEFIASYVGPGKYKVTSHYIRMEYKEMKGASRCIY